MLPEPRPYQAAGVDALRGHILAGRRRVILCCPTGGGKTVLASSIIHSARRNFDAKILFVAHRVELINQAVAQLAKWGVTEVGVIRADDERTNALMPVQVATIQSLGRRNKPPADIIFVDEAHRCVANSYRKLLELYPDAVIIGLTATPCRLDGKALGDVFQAIEVAATYKDLIKDGFIVEPQCFGTPVEPKLDGIKTQNGDFVIDELADAMMEIDVLGDTVAEYKKHAKGRRTVVFAVNVAHSKALLEKFLAAGVRAAHVDADTPEAERLDISRKLDVGELEVVTNVSILTEGWDCLDEETEVMTPSGWAGYDKISIGSDIYALDRDSKKICVVPVLDVGRRPVRDGERMVAIQSQHVNIRVTEGHRIYVSPRRNGGDLVERTAREMVEKDTGIYSIPLTGTGIDFPGVALTDDELRFVAWFMTDGGFQQNDTTVVISQAKSYHHEIRSLLDRLGLDYGERVRQNSSGFVAGKLLPIHIFRIPKGTRKGTMFRKGWFDKFANYLDKNVSSALYGMTRDQFRLFWTELLKGDGEQLNKSGWLWCDRKKQADTYTRMAIERGFSASYSERITLKGKTVYRVSVREKSWITSDRNDPRSARVAFEDTKPNEQVWCVTNRLGTIVTRRGGKSIVLGNCPPVKCMVLARPTKSITVFMQMAGRALRPWNEKTPNGYGVFPARAWRPEDGPSVVPIIIDQGGNLDRHGFPHEDRRWSLEGRAERENEKKPTKCIKCLAYIKHYPCPACGFAPVVTPREIVQNSNAELEERVFTDPRKAFFDRKVEEARLKGFKPTFASMKFKDEYGEWPPFSWGQAAKNAFALDEQWRRRMVNKEADRARWKKQDEEVRTPQYDTDDDFLDWARRET